MKNEVAAVNEREKSFAEPLDEQVCEDPAVSTRVRMFSQRVLIKVGRCIKMLQISNAPPVISSILQVA